MATLNDYYSRVNRTMVEDVDQYEINNFIETGTGLGDTVAYALSNSQKLINIWSIEIHKDIANRAAHRFRDYASCEIINNNSHDGLLELIPLLRGNSMFFLDAHFPGADFGYANYSDNLDGDIKLPLQKELELLCSKRDVSNDIFLIDDLRIYEEGDYEMGNWSKQNGGVHTGIDFVYDCLGGTHNIEKHLFYSGFITALPKKS